MANSNGWGDGAANNAIGWGQGANNAIGWGDSHSKSWAGLTDISGTPTTDPDAQAFITAASITDPTQQAAINTLVVDLKADSLWTKMKAVYPFVGGTSTTHKFNLKNPLDTDAAYRLVFSGGITHSSTGVLPNGTNGLANTYLNPLSKLTNNNLHLSYYSRTNVAAVNPTFEMGVGYLSGDIDDTRCGLVVKSSSTFSSSQIGYIDGVNNTLASTSSISNTAYFAIASRISSTSNKLYSNGVVAATNTTSNVKALPNDTILLFGINNILSPASALYSNRQCAFASIGDGLTDTEVTNLNTRVTTFQTALNRNI